MEKAQGIRYSHASQPIEATGAALCPYSATVYAQFCSFKDKENDYAFRSRNRDCSFVISDAS